MNKKLVSLLFEIAGWIGVILILGGYYLLATGVIKGDAYPYHILMLIGSVCVAVVSYQKRAWQPMALNVVFILLATIALIRLSL